MVISRRWKIVTLLCVLGLSSYGIVLMLRGRQIARGLEVQKMEQRASDLELQKAASIPVLGAPPQSAELGYLSEAKTKRKEKAGPASAPVASAPKGRYPAPIMAFTEDSKVPQKLILSADLTVDIKGYDDAFNRVQDIAAEAGGYIASIQAQRPEKDHAQGRITLRVPPSTYFSTLNKLRGLGSVEAETIGTQDVTRQCLNLDSRISQEHEMRTRMWDATRARANNLDSLMDADYNIGQVSDQLDGMESERYKLQQDIRLSTINLTLLEPAVAMANHGAKPAKPGLWAPVGAAVQNAVAELVSDVSQALYLAIVLLPWLTLGWLLWRPFWKWMLQFRNARLKHDLDTV
jgi:hypothetical protein